MVAWLLGGLGSNWRFWVPFCLRFRLLEELEVLGALLPEV